MDIQLIGSKVAKLTLSKLEDEGEIEAMEFSVSTAFTQSQSNNFIIDFNLKLKVEESNILTVQHISQFEANSEIKEDDKKSPFFSINAPAIAYPFLRAYVSNFLLSSGYEPVILPTINFVKLAKSNKQQS